MRKGIAPEHLQAPAVAGLFILTPNTAMAGALIEPPDWSIFDQDVIDGVHEWSEEEIVYLHWRLLQDIQVLADPDGPLEEKVATLRWIFTEPDKDSRPFSFANCLRVVGCSPLSPIAYCGAVDCEAIRQHIARDAGKWLRETLVRYPAWVREALLLNPDWVDAQLTRNPQWINEQLKRLDVQGDLFA